MSSRPFIVSLVFSAMIVVGSTVGGVLSVGAGLRRAFALHGLDNRVVVSSIGSRNEAESVIPPDQLGIITAPVGVVRSSAEVVAISMVPDTSRNDIVMTRGLDPVGFEMHDIRIIEGRMPKPRAPEIIVGEALQKHMSRLKIGAKITLVNLEFTCVGIFRSDSFMSGEAITTRSSFRADDPRRNDLSVVYLETRTPDEIPNLERQLLSDRGLKVTVMPEKQFYKKMAGEHQNMVRGLTLIFVLVVSGAVLVAASLLSLYQSRRLSELCVMRALGFRTIKLSRLIVYETEFMVLTGGGLGVLLIAVVLRDYVVSSTSNSLSSVVFTAPLGAGVAWVTLCAMVVIGICGAIAPIIRMSRAGITQGLRED